MNLKVLIFNIFFLVYQVEERHSFLVKLFGSVKPEELTSYQNVKQLFTTSTVCIASFSVLEVVTYFVYLSWVG